MIPRYLIFACRVLDFLSRHHDGAKNDDIKATLGETKRRYNEPVMQRLSRSGLVISQRGPAGGYRLTHTGATATLLDVYHALCPHDTLAPRLLAHWGRMTPSDLARAYEADQRAKMAA